MKARIINTNVFGGLFTSEFLDQYMDTIINGQLVSEWELIDTLPDLYQLTFVDLRWNGTEWFESATSEQIALIKTPVYGEKLQLLAADLRIRAKAAAINKKGSSAYIFSQVELYEIKYKIASGAISNPYYDELLTNEAIEFGSSIGVEMDLNAFKELIIYMYETALGTYELFLLMIERCRTKIQTLIENKEWSKVDTAFSLIENLNDASQAQTLMSEILEL